MSGKRDDLQEDEDAKPRRYTDNGKARGFGCEVVGGWGGGTNEW